MNGSIYAYYVVCRGLECLKVDGIFNYANSAFEWGISKLTLTTNTYESHDLAFCKPSDDNQTELQFINDKPVSVESFESFSKEQDDKKDTAWYELSEKNIEKELSNK